MPSGAGPVLCTHPGHGGPAPHPRGLCPLRNFGQQTHPSCREVGAQPPPSLRGPETKVVAPTSRTCSGTACGSRGLRVQGQLLHLAGTDTFPPCASSSSPSPWTARGQASLLGRWSPITGHPLGSEAHSGSPRLLPHSGEAPQPPGPLAANASDEPDNG